MSDEGHDFGWAAAQAWSQGQRVAPVGAADAVYMHRKVDENVFRWHDGMLFQYAPETVARNWQLYVEPKPKPQAITVTPYRSETPEVPPIDEWIVYWWDGTEWRRTKCGTRRDGLVVLQDREEDNYPAHLFNLTGPTNG